jgi:hypothetical protein
MMMAKKDVMKTGILDAFEEVIWALALYQDREEREIELIVRSDGTACLMGASDAGVWASGESGTGFEEIASFESFDELWEALTATEGTARAPEEVEE